MNATAFVGCSAIGQCEVRAFADLALLSGSDTDVGPRGRYCGNPNARDLPQDDEMIEKCPVWRYVTPGRYSDTAVGVVTRDTSAVGAPTSLYLVSSMESKRDNNNGLAARSDNLYFEGSGLQRRTRYDRITKRELPGLGVSCGSLVDGVLTPTTAACFGKAAHFEDTDPEAQDNYFRQWPVRPENSNSTNTSAIETAMYTNGTLTEFLAGWSDLHHVYLLQQEHGTGASVARFCKGSPDFNPIAFNAFSRLTVTCGMRVIAAVAVEATSTALQARGSHVLVMIGAGQDNSDGSPGPGTVCIHGQNDFTGGRAGCPFDERVDSQFQATEGARDFVPLGGDSCTERNEPDISISTWLRESSHFGNFGAEYFADQLGESPAFSSVTLDQANGEPVLYVGTDDGRVVQMALRQAGGNCPAGPGPHLEATSLTLLQGPPDRIERITVDAVQDVLLVATAAALAQVRIERCERHTMCGSCLTGDATATGDVYCGWCTLSARCSSMAQCLAEQELPQSRGALGHEYWVGAKAGVGSCPAVTAATETVPAGHPTLVNATVTGIPPARPGFQFYCELTAESTATSAAASSGALRHQVNESVSIVECQPMAVAINDAGDVTINTPAAVTVRYGPSGHIGPISELPVLATVATGMTVYDCGVLASCGACSASRFGCNWCALSSDCVPAISSDTCAVAVGTPDQCPSTLVVSPLALHTNADLPNDAITVRSANLPQPAAADDVYTCEFSDGDAGVIVGYGTHVSATEISCAVPTTLPGLTSTTPLSTRAEGLIPYGVVVKVNGVPIPQLTALVFTVFACPEVAQRSGDQDCARCIGHADAPYQCGWCSAGAGCSLQSSCSGAGVWGSSLPSCPRPAINGFLPLFGPSEGGTRVTVVGSNFGRDSEGFSLVVVGGTAAAIHSYAPATGTLVVITGPTNRTSTSGVGRPQAYADVVEVHFSDAGVDAIRSDGPFTYVHPLITATEPVVATAAGGTSVTLSGSNLGVGSSARVWLDGRLCGDITNVTTDELVCTLLSASATAASGYEPPSGTGGSVCVIIDAALCIESGSTPVSFDILDDPTIAMVSPHHIIAAGAVMVAARGNSTGIAASPSVVVMDPASTGRVSVIAAYSSETAELRFTMPALADLSASAAASAVASAQFEYNVTLEFHFDDAVATFTVPYIANPMVNAVTPLEGTPGANIQISGSNLFRGGTPSVFFGTVEAVISLELSDDANLVVVVPARDPDTAEFDVELSVTLAGWQDTHQHTFNYTAPGIDTSSSGDGTPEDSIGLVIAVPVAGALVLALVVVGGMYRYKIIKRRKMERLLLGRMNRLEAQIVDVCKQGFTELQSGSKLTVQGIDSWATLRPVDAFLGRVMFTSPATHPAPDGSALRAGVSNCVEPFLNILLNEQFVLLMASAIERGQGTTIKDKCHVAALLQVVVGGDQEYSFALLKGLLTKLLAAGTTKKHPKLALRRTETIAEKFVSCWLSQELYPVLAKKVGRPLWELLQALRMQSQKGPIDAVTGAAMYTLNGNKLLKEHVKSNRLEIGVLLTVLGADAIEVTVTVNDLDTPSQCIQKVLEATGHGADVSEIVPDVSAVALVEVGWPVNGMLLQDVDSTSALDPPTGSVRLNTMSHYKIEAGAKFNLVPNPKSAASSEKPGRRRSSSAGKGDLRLTADKWHLIRPENHGVGSKGKGKAHQDDGLPAEVYLTYMLTMKGIVQPYVDSVLQGMFDAGDIPNAIKQLFDFLDATAGELGYNDPNVLHIWKNNALPLRFWVNMIKNPDFLYEVDVNDTTNSNLSTVAQVVMDATSTSKQELSRHSPVNKLLYTGEVDKYKAHVKDYYAQVAAESPRISLRGKSSQRKQVPGKYNAAFMLLGYCSPHRGRLIEELHKMQLGNVADDFDQCCNAYEVQQRGGAGAGSTTAVNTGFVANPVDDVSNVARRPPKASARQSGQVRAPSALQDPGYIDVSDNRGSALIDADMFEMQGLGGADDETTSGFGSRPQSLMGFSEFVDSVEGSRKGSVAGESDSDSDDGAAETGEYLQPVSGYATVDGGSGGYIGVGDPNDPDSDADADNFNHDPKRDSTSSVELVQNTGL